MSNQTNDNIRELAAQIIDELGSNFSEGVMPTIMEVGYSNLVDAVEADDLDNIQKWSMELGQYLAHV